MRRHRWAVAAIATMLLTLALAAGTSFALQTHKEGAQVSGASTPNQGANGGFGPLGGLAVASGGDLYVIDAAGSASSGLENTGAVHRFDSAGAYQDTIDGADTEPPSPVGLGLSSDSRVAVDASGNLYLTDTNNNRVLAFSGSGAALSSFGSDGQIDGSEALPGSEDKTPTNGFGGYLCGIAVDPVNGDILVSDAFNNRVWIFDATGKYQGRIADSVQLNGPCGLAFDSTGDLYVRNWFAANVVKFHRSGDRAFDFERVAYQPDNFTPEDPSDDLPEPTDVAVDMTTNNLFVDGATQITEFEQSGGLLTRFAKGAFTSGFSASIAVDGAGGRIYASDGNLLRTFSTTVTTLPDATTGAAEEITGESGTLTGTVDGLGIQTQCVFEYGLDESYGQSAPCEPAGPYSGAQAVSAQIGGLSAGTTYHYRLRATTPVPDEFTAGADRTFVTTGAPVISSTSVSEVLPATAKLVAHIDPSGAKTSYRFEYVTATEYQVSGFLNALVVPVPDGALLPASGSRPVAELGTGLAPNTRYYFHLVASNSVGSAESAPKQFETPEAPTTVQITGEYPGKGFLPDNRSWELVSPPDKNGGFVRAKGPVTLASQDGNRVAYTAPANFGESNGTGVLGFTQYVATRGSSGWRSTSVTPRPNPVISQTIFAPTISKFSTSLSRIATKAYDLDYVEGDISLGFENLYLHDLGGKTFTPLTAPQVGPVPEFATSEILGGSEDFSTVYFESQANLLPGATGFAERKIYEWHDGVLQLVKPDTAEESPEGGVRPGWGRAQNADATNTVSSDGARALYVAPAEGPDQQLYLRKNHSHSVPLGMSERSAPAEAAKGVKLQATNTSVDIVAFSTESRLTEDDPGGSGEALYLYRDSADPEVEKNLEYVMRFPGAIASVPGMSTDGTSGFIYAGSLYHWSPAGIVAAPTTPGDWALGSAFSYADTHGNGSIQRFIGQARVSTDGRRIAFLSDAELTDTPLGIGENGSVLPALYTYEVGDANYKCVSCPRTGEATNSVAYIWPLEFEGFEPALYPRTRYMARNGARLFFATADPLVAADVNGKVDVYQYDVQRDAHSLISSGQSKFNSWFAEASSDGENVFLITRDQLSRHDVDTLSDLYVARVNGGLPEPVRGAQGCEGDACQPSPVSFNDPTPASAALLAPNGKPPRGDRGKCAKSKHRCHRANRGNRKRRGKGTRKETSTKRDHDRKLVS